MSLETDLVTVLRTQCARVRPIDGNVNETRPFVTYQHIGGDALRYMDGTAADKRHALVQVDVFADTAAEAIALSLAIENAVCTASAFSARPQGALRSGHEEAAQLYRCIQEFEVLGAR